MRRPSPLNPAYSQAFQNLFSGSIRMTVVGCDNGNGTPQQVLMINLLEHGQVTLLEWM